MKKNFDFIYNLMSEEYELCFKNDITKCDIENVIKDYIVNNCISSEDYYLVNYKDDIKIYFYIDYLDNFGYSVEIHDIYIVD